MIELLQAGLLFISGIVASWLTHKATNRKTKQEAQSSELEIQAEQARMLIESLDSRLKDVEDQLRELRSDNYRLETENLDLKHQVRNKDEIISGFVAWTEIYSSWLDDHPEGGGEPPPPAFTWQMRHAIRALKSMGADP